jgi:NAD(P)-dependent dehydrogenase (short-subunit alcohol dehydrogenase family)
MHPAPTDIAALFSLQGRAAIVTGGSRGLGFQLARALGLAGARVLITARKKEALLQAVASLQAEGIEAIAFTGNGADEAELAALTRFAMESFGRIDILVNNAGAVWSAPAEQHPLDAWDKVMHLNVRAPFVLSQLVANSAMIAQGGGRIINMGSIAGFGGNTPNLTSIAYNTSKGALHNFTRALAAEWGQHGITVNAICPGFFVTKMSAGALSSGGDEKMRAATPLRRLGDETDLMGAALLFASDAGKHITGQCLAVDGGVSAVIG